MALMQHEALLLAQAFYKDGTASFDGVSRSMVGHPATTGRHAFFSPAACAQHYRNLFAAERVDSSQLPPDVKQPRSRTHLKLIRKYYLLREIEARERLCRQEEQMRVLSRELSELDQGLWDSRLTDSYILIEPSPDPALAKYAHVNSAAAIAFRTQVAPGHAREATVLDTAETTGVGDSSGAGEQDDKSQSAGRNTPTATPGRTLPDIAHAGSAFRSVAIDQLAHIPEAAEEEGVPSDATLQVVDGRMAAGDHQVVGHQTEATAKHRIPERRSSSRPSRLAPSDSQAHMHAGRGTAEEYDRLQGAAVTSQDESLSPHTAGLDIEDGEEPRRSGKGRRRSSGPREGNKRRRTDTPQARGPSPALSDVSRAKRVKTEEMESSVSTPVAEYERTPFSSTDPSSSRRFRNTAPHLIGQLQGSVYSTYFKDPVKEGEAVNYFEIVKRPMDLKTLLQHVKAGRVASTLEFTRDIYLIFANAIMYNGPENYVGQDAMALFKEAQGLLQVLEQAESRLL